LKTLLLILSLWIPASLLAQSESIDKPVGQRLFAVSGFYAYEIPGADLAIRFGNNHRVGGNFTYKLKSDWALIFEGSYVFGDNLEPEGYSILDPIETSFGQITSKFGTPSDIVLSESGYNFNVKFGKLLPWLRLNPQSGFLIAAGVGFMQHKIRIDNAGNDAPQIYGEYRKGYDHMSSGLALSQFVGYMYFSNNRLLNGFIGFDFTQGFTKNRRGFNYNTGQYDQASRLDLIYSFRAGVMIPIARRNVQAFFEY